jgi:hypothetical protein
MCFGAAACPYSSATKELVQCGNYWKDKRTLLSPEIYRVESVKYRTLNIQYRIMKAKLRYWTFKIHYSILLSQRFILTNGIAF